jgi:hypothetical protein
VPVHLHIFLYDITFSYFPQRQILIDSYEAGLTDLQFFVFCFGFYSRDLCVSYPFSKTEGLLNHNVCAKVLMLIKLGIFMRRNRTNSSELRVLRILEIIALRLH